MKPLGLTINAQYTKRVDYIYDAGGQAITNIHTNETFPIKQQIGSGSFGSVFETSGNRIVKSLNKLEPGSWRHLQEEVTLQTKLHERDPDVCPRIYEHGITENGEAIVIMEKYVDIAGKVLKDFTKLTDRSNYIIYMLDYMYSIASILQRLEKYQFNHRDLKSDNIMYKLDKKNQIQYVLIDFGFSCATFDGVKYQGTSYYPPTTECFRRSRDLTMMVYELLRYATDPEFRKFLQLLLTFTYNGKRCDMSQRCEPDFKNWATIYQFTNNVENPNLTPEGLMSAIEVFANKGLEGCKSGFVVHPVENTCVAEPPLPSQDALTVPMSPKQHMLNPVPAAKGGKRKTRKQKRTVG